MTDVGYVISGYIVVVGAVSSYGWWLLRRGRKLSRQVPGERRRWA